jgi:hypothetical protein
MNKKMLIRKLNSQVSALLEDSPSACGKKINVAVVGCMCLRQDKLGKF